MKPLLAILSLTATVLVTNASFAVEKTVTLAVENMYCASCPYIVKKSLSSVQGVTDVKVSFERKTAKVTFDDSQTDVDALTNATFDSGYPSELVKKGG